jgi:histidyl-tRNA synthetase
MEIQRLPGFRDFYPDDYAWREYIFSGWRETARLFAFQEYDGPMLESTDLYRKKSGEELKTQLYRFVDQGNRDVCLRPEMTPTLARLVAARERDFKKPIKWFSVASFFRSEKPQKGRLREFSQVNCDILGESSPAADAELIALAIQMLLRFGLTPEDFYVRLNDRRLWRRFLDSKGVAEDGLTEVLAIVDKIERESEVDTQAKLKQFGLSLEEIRAFLSQPVTNLSDFEPLLRELRWRGLQGFVEVDLTVVRGLDYYTGFVFEIFDRQRESRSLAGGGRYDQLISTISDGAVDLAAAGFAMGDVTVQDLLASLPHTRARAESAFAARYLQVYVAIADEDLRPEAVGLITRLREQNLRVDFALQPTKLGKQLQLAEAAHAPLAVVVGREWPEVKVKTLSDRSETVVPVDELQSFLTNAMRGEERVARSE